MRFIFPVFGLTSSNSKTKFYSAWLPTNIRHGQLTISWSSLYGILKMTSMNYCRRNFTSQGFPRASNHDFGAMKICPIYLKTALRGTIHGKYPYATLRVIFQRKFEREWTGHSHHAHFSPRIIKSGQHAFIFIVYKSDKWCLNFNKKITVEVINDHFMNWTFYFSGDRINVKM